MIDWIKENMVVSIVVGILLVLAGIGIVSSFRPSQQTKIEEAETETVQAVKDTKIDWQKQKEEQALKRKKENQLAKLEERIEEIEEKIKELSDMLELEEVYTDAHRSREIFEEKEKLEEDLMDVYEEYEELS